jgi:hypothetical protein
MHDIIFMFVEFFQTEIQNINSLEGTSIGVSHQNYYYCMLFMVALSNIILFLQSFF